MKEFAISSRRPETVIMFKPDAQEIQFECPSGGRRELHEVSAALLVVSGLRIKKYSRKSLTKTDIHALYEAVLSPNPEDDAIWGTDWKNEVVDHLSSAPVDSYLLQGPNEASLEVVRDLKNWLRQHYGRLDNVVQNIAHVPDLGELAVTKEVLFE